MTGPWCPPPRPGYDGNRAVHGAEVTGGWTVGVAAMDGAAARGAAVERGQRMTGTIEGAEAGRGADRGTVAWIEFGTQPGTRNRDAAHLDDLALGQARRQIERAVRGDDRVCPVSTASVVVEFGSVAAGVSPRALGDRLARAIGPGLPFDHSDATLTVAVGVAAAVEGDHPAVVSLRARSAARSSLRSLTRVLPGAGPSTAAVTVDEPAALPVPAGSPTWTPGPHRRPVRRYGAQRVFGVPTFVAEGGDPDGTRPAGLWSSSLCVLVVDPMATRTGATGFPVQTVLSVTEHLGCRASGALVRPDDPLVMSVGGEDVDLVILVLDGAWSGASPDWATGAWGLPSRLTGAYVDKGTPVLAVSAGAGAGAVAACVAKGALAVFSLDCVADAIRSLDGLSVDEARQVAELGFPARFSSLVGLTAGERRVLFHLTQGWTAQEVADELVVSLTTVRSHIRSVLRKLGVRSQLAAVAIANSRDLEHQPVAPGS